MCTSLRSGGGVWAAAGGDACSGEFVETALDDAAALVVGVESTTAALLVVVDAVEVSSAPDGEDEASTSARAGRTIDRPSKASIIMPTPRPVTAIELLFMPR